MSERELLALVAVIIYQANRADLLFRDAVAEAQDLLNHVDRALAS